MLHAACMRQLVAMPRLLPAGSGIEANFLLSALLGAQGGLASSSSLSMSALTFRGTLKTRAGLGPVSCTDLGAAAGSGAGRLWFPSARDRLSALSCSLPAG